MKLQSRYRLERDKISTFENDEFYFAYQIIDDELHILEMFIVEEKRGMITIFYEKIFSIVKEENKDINLKYIVATIIPKIDYSEKALYSLLRFGFKLLKAENNIITIYWEIK